MVFLCLLLCFCFHSLLSLRLRRSGSFTSSSVALFPSSSYPSWAPGALLFRHLCRPLAPACLRFLALIWPSCSGRWPLFYPSTVCSLLWLPSHLPLFSGVGSVPLLELRWAGSVCPSAIVMLFLIFHSQRTPSACLGLASSSMPPVYHSFLGIRLSCTFLPFLESILPLVFSALALCQVLVSSLIVRCSSLFLLWHWLIVGFPLRSFVSMSLVCLPLSSWLVFPFHGLLYPCALGALFPCGRYSLGVLLLLSLSPLSLGSFQVSLGALLPRSNLRFSPRQGPPFGPSQLPIRAVCAPL